MKITLIPERCIACGLCQTYSDLFDYHDNGIVRFYDDPNLLERDIRATGSCKTVSHSRAHQRLICHQW